MSQATLHREIIALSDADNWDEARTEWELTNVWMSDEPQTCLCGHNPIHEICEITNQENGSQTEVGNWCVKNFMEINSELVFASLRKVLADIEASFNDTTIRLAHERKLINDWERKFYLKTWRKRSPSERELAKRKQINAKMLRAFSR